MWLSLKRQKDPTAVLDALDGFDHSPKIAAEETLKGVRADWVRRRPHDGVEAGRITPCLEPQMNGLAWTANGENDRRGPGYPDVLYAPPHQSRPELFDEGTNLGCTQAHPRDSGQEGATAFRCLTVVL